MAMVNELPLLIRCILQRLHIIDGRAFLHGTRCYRVFEQLFLPRLTAARWYVFASTCITMERQQRRLCETTYTTQWNPPCTLRIPRGVRGTIACLRPSTVPNISRVTFRQRRRVRHQESRFPPLLLPLSPTYKSCEPAVLPYGRLQSR